MPCSIGIGRLKSLGTVISSLLRPWAGQVGQQLLLNILFGAGEGRPMKDTILSPSELTFLCKWVVSLFLVAFCWVAVEASTDHEWHLLDRPLLIRNVTRAPCCLQFPPCIPHLLGRVCSKNGWLGVKGTPCSVHLEVGSLQLGRATCTSVLFLDQAGCFSVMLDVFGHLH